jgi:hypothetical protein
VNFRPALPPPPTWAEGLGDCGVDLRGGRPEVILVKGSRAIYENTLFSFENNVYAHWFSGHVSCPHINQLHP